MSQEQPPIRSRRELRQARDERQEVEPGTPAPRGPARCRSPACPASGTAPAARPDGANPASRPTRGTDRGRNHRPPPHPGPVDSVRTTRRRTVLPDPGPRPGRAAHHQGTRGKGGPALARRSAHAPPAPAPAAGRGDRPCHLGQPDRAACPRRGPALVPQAARPGQPRPQAACPAGRHPQPGRRRPESAADAERARAPGSKLPEGMTVEQALAARELLAEAGPQPGRQDGTHRRHGPRRRRPGSPRRADRPGRARRRPEPAGGREAEAGRTEASQPATPPKTDPRPPATSRWSRRWSSSKVPGVERPVMKRPATSYVPVVTNPSPQVAAAGTKRAAADPSRQRDAAAGHGPRRRPCPSRGGRAGCSRSRGASRPAAAEPAAAEAEEDFADRPPVAANTAYGLDPLDAATAGLGRAHRLRAAPARWSWPSGIVALIAGDHPDHHRAGP